MGRGYKKTHEEFVKEVALINPDIEVISMYINNKTKVRFKCKKDNYIWETNPYVILQGHKCPRCAGIERYTTETFKEKLKPINSNIEILGEYITSNKKIKVRCKLDGYEWNIRPNDLLSGYGCPVCGKVKRRTHEEFVKEMYTVDSSIEILSHYTNSYGKVHCRCKNDGHEWYSPAQNLLWGYGCSECNNKSKLEKKTSDYLKNNDIIFIPQQTFPFLLGVNGGMLSYDFYLPYYNIIIECQGKQHLKPVEFFGGEKTFKIQQEHDKRKREYAKLHNIELLEIWYYEIKKVEQILQEKLNINSKRESA